MSGGNYRSADGTSTELPLSAAQLGFWFAQQLDPQNAGFNVGEYLEIHGPIDPTLFQAALRQGILETDVLRIRLVERAGEPRQIIAESAEWSLPYMDVSGEVDPAMAALSWMSADMERPTDLLRGPLFAFALFKAEADIRHSPGGRFPTAMSQVRLRRSSRTTPLIGLPMILRAIANTGTNISTTPLIRRVSPTAASSDRAA